VKHDHLEYALFLENGHEEAFLIEEEKKKEEVEEVKRAEQKIRNRLHEQLAEKADLETNQMAEQKQPEK